MRAGLTIKLAILLAGIGILASGLTGYYAYSANRAMLVGAAQRNLLTSTQLLSRRLSTAINDIASDARVLSTLPAAPVIISLQTSEGEQGLKDRLAPVFASVLKAHPEYLQIRLISAEPNGMEQVRVDRDGPRLMRIDGDQLQEKGHYPYVFETLQLRPGEVYLSRLMINHEDGAHAAEGQPTLQVATPVLTTAGKVGGVLVVNVSLTNLFRLLKADLPSHYQLYLTNHWGDFLIHPGAAQTFGFDKGRRILIQDSFRATVPLFRHTTDSVVVNGVDDPKQAQGQVLAFVRKPFGQREQQFLVLGLSRPLSDVLMGADALGRRIVHMVLAFSLLSIVLAVAFARALARPLNMLARAATRFSSDQSMEKLPLKRGDEIGILARCFDQMRQQLKTDMSNLYDRQQELTHLARHDSLTGLPNRMLFFQQLEQAMREAIPREQQLAVLFVDLDHFKDINDQWGHAVGDQVLHTAAQRLLHALRSEDTVARLGGDEFIVLLQGVGEANHLAAIAQKILDNLSQPMRIGGQSLLVGASVGISRFPQDGNTAEELVQHADQAMYEAKTHGRHTFALYHPPMNS